MSDYNALRDTGKTLISLLWDNMKKNDHITSTIINSDQSIALASPEEVPDEKKLSIFLYQITEDSFQKNQPLITDKNSVNSLQGPSLYLNLFYMITPNTKNEENDLILLGKVAEIFNDNRVLRGPVLQGSLAENGEDLRLIFNPLSLDEVNKIWTVVSKSKPYRHSLYYEVAPVRIDSAQALPIRRVSERDLRYKDKSVNG